MQIITISKSCEYHGNKFAQKLADKLGYLCISREEILEEATKNRIAIGKLETSIIKPHIFSEELALELEHYKALATFTLCEKALSNNIVYHGRTGHLLLPGINHILKIRVIADTESRIEETMKKLGLSREKTIQYLDQLDTDRKKWVKQFYNVDWDVSSLYDLVLNLNHMNAENAATAVCSLAQLPEFQVTPSITKLLHDLRLASKARLLLFSDKRTSNLNIKVRVNDKNVYVTYLSQQIKNAELISDVLSQLKEAKKIICTEAETNILWVQEKFDSQDTSYHDVIRLAGLWDAAVELYQITPSESSDQISEIEEAKNEDSEAWRETGIMEDKEEKVDESGISKIYEKLINDGKAGGKKIIKGSQKTLLNAIDRSISYRLIILDNIFISKGHAAQTRLQREWSNFIRDNLKIPILSLEEIRSKYQFSIKELIKMIIYAAFIALFVFLIFQYDEPILTFLSHKGLGWRVAATLCVFAFVPLFAYTYSTVTKLFFKLIKLD